MRIPARGHFCWLGTRLPWAYVFAVLSAAQNSDLQEITLHHVDPLEIDAGLRALELCPRVRLVRLDPIACLRQAGNDLGIGDRLAAIYRAVAAPAIRTDVLRAAILYLEGGVYLDVDTITTRSLLPLLGASQFIGCEFLVWPRFARTSRSPALWCRTVSLDLLRKSMRRLPGGWRVFRHVEGWCYVGVNNAVMGAEARSRLCAECLCTMAAMAPEQWSEPFALGPDLLQEMIGRFHGGELAIAEPHVFYPLPPQISEHWFRLGRRVQLDAVLYPQTRVVHWYASVRTAAKVAAIDPAYVRKHRENQLYSALVCSSIRDLPAAA